MGLENQTTKQTYIGLLAEILKRKIEVLKLLMDLSVQQEQILTAEAFDEDLFLTTIDQKEEQINRLNTLDEGFDKIYNGVKEELSVDKVSYTSEILLMKDLITEITDMSVKLQAIEKRNKEKLEQVLVEKRKEIKNFRVSNQTATNYYKTMAQQHEAQSYFYDKKN
jgi:hypothetical protein